MYILPQKKTTEATHIYYPSVTVGQSVMHTQLSWTFYFTRPHHWSFVWRLYWEILCFHTHTKCYWLIQLLKGCWIQKLSSSLVNVSLSVPCHVVFPTWQIASSKPERRESMLEAKKSQSFITYQRIDISLPYYIG